MKKNETSNRPNSRPAGEYQSRPVHIEFSHPTAAAVRIAGSFNEWRPEATPMISVGAGRWAKELTLPPGTYEYCLVVDGAFLPDPQAQETAPNPFGGVNSVLRVSVPA